MPELLALRERAPRLLWVETPSNPLMAVTDIAALAEGEQAGELLERDRDVTVEDALTRLPGVREAVVLGLPDPEWGQAVGAVVEPAPGAEPPDAAAVLVVVTFSSLIAPHLAGR